MESSITERAREFMESSKKRKRERERERGKKMREPESFWNQVEVKKKKKKMQKMRELEKERMRELLESSGSKEKEKGEEVLIDNGIRVWWTKCQRKKRKEKGNVWMKERQRIRNHNLKILL